MKRIKRIICIALISGLILAFFVLKSDEKKGIYRLHIIANSNSESDQAVKLCVRDAILDTERVLLADRTIDNAAQARSMLMDNAHEIYDSALDTLIKNGKDYGVKLSTGTYHFPDKTYGGELYPEGDYDAMRVVLGDGKGENWWCVMFPPLCITDINSVQNSDKSTDDTVGFKSIFGELGKWLCSLFNIC